jgi:hypothetical protein
MELIGAIASAGLSAAGQMITANEARENAERMAAARNEKLSVAMKKNDDLAAKSRAEFDARQKNATADAIEQDRADKTQQREEQLTQAVDAAPGSVEPSLSGSAPTVIKSDLAKRMAAAMGDAKESAKAQAKLGGYGDAWLGQGFQDVQAGRNIGTNANFASGNMAILPYQQDIAEQRAYKPISPIGGLLSGFGSMLGSYSGGGAVPKRTYASPATWAQANRGYI